MINNFKLTLAIFVVLLEPLVIARGARVVDSPIQKILHLGSKHKHIVIPSIGATTILLVKALKPKKDNDKSNSDKENNKFQGPVKKSEKDNNGGNITTASPINFVEEKIIKPQDDTQNNSFILPKQQSFENVLEETAIQKQDYKIEEETLPTQNHEGPLRESRLVVEEQLEQTSNQYYSKIVKDESLVPDNSRLPIYEIKQSPELKGSEEKALDDEEEDSKVFTPEEQEQYNDSSLNGTAYFQDSKEHIISKEEKSYIISPLTYQKNNYLLNTPNNKCFDRSQILSIDNDGYHPEHTNVNTSTISRYDAASSYDDLLQEKRKLNFFHQDISFSNILSAQIYNKNFIGYTQTKQYYHKMIPIKFRSRENNSQNMLSNQLVLNKNNIPSKTTSTQLMNTQSFKYKYIFPMLTGEQNIMLNKFKFIYNLIIQSNQQIEPIKMIMPRKRLSIINSGINTHDNYDNALQNDVINLGNMIMKAQHKKHNKSNELINNFHILEEKHAPALIVTENDEQDKPHLITKDYEQQECSDIEAQKQSNIAPKIQAALQYFLGLTYSAQYPYRKLRLSKGDVPIPNTSPIKIPIEQWFSQGQNTINKDNISNLFSSKNDLNFKII